MRNKAYLWLPPSFVLGYPAKPKGGLEAPFRFLDGKATVARRNGLQRRRSAGKEPDWREPHPEAYQLLPLELGLGLRREKSDNAQWDWFFVLNGRRYIEVKKTD